MAEAMSDPAALCPWCSAPLPDPAVERCPSCQFLLIEKKTLAAFSEDKDRLFALMEEAQSLRLPTSKACPRCFDKFHDGRISSLGIIVTACPTCATLSRDPGKPGARGEGSRPSRVWLGRGADGVRGVIMHPPGMKMG